MATPTLLTKELERALPAIWSGDNVARVKYFTPWANWTWYASEASRKRGLDSATLRIPWPSEQRGRADAA